MQKRNKVELVKRYGTSNETSQYFGLGTDKLKKMRMFGVGPEYRVAGHRTVLYDWEKFEAWLASLPKGGGGQ